MILRFYDFANLEFHFCEFLATLLNLMKASFYWQNVGSDFKRYISNIARTTSNKCKMKLARRGPR